MSKKDKLIKRIKTYPKDFSIDELRNLLRYLDFYEADNGKTSGSRIKFINKNKGSICLHSPHPGNELKYYQIKQIVEFLTKEDLI